MSRLRSASLPPAALAAAFVPAEATEVTETAGRPGAAGSPALPPALRDEAPPGTAADLGSTWYRPMGLTLELITNSAPVRAAAELALRGFGLPPPPPVRPAQLTFRLLEHELDDRAPGAPVLRTAGPLIYQTTGRDSVLVADCAAGFAYGFFSASTLADPAYFRWHFLDLALFFMLEWRGFVGVHGAALAHRGRALLLRAPSGAGKSTLAYGAARRRFQALAEDVVWLDVAGGRWWGAPWSFHLLPDASRLFPELAGVAPSVQLNGSTKLAIDLEALRPGSTTPVARAGAVVVLRRRPGGASRLERLDPADARREWLAGGASREREASGYERRIAEVLRGGCYRLTLGDDLDRALDLLEPLFAEPDEPRPSGAAC
ncbi:MAG TPA: hypothetical protein VHR45_15810 [Thermoanaerobaculia bacterium]|nr:hypothetical protein [Thermoanaerobaculia bacterium]